MAMGYEESHRRHLDACRKSSAVTHQVRRMNAIEAYGGKCARCGAVNYPGFMVVPLGNGPHWRERFPDPPPQGARNKFRWLAKHNYPEGFGLVCGPTCRAWLLQGR